MAFDAAVSLRIVNNERLRRSESWGEYRDLRGALVFTSDAPTADSNRVESFTADDSTIEDLLDIGFALLRAFDCEPAACVTPLDHPVPLEERLGRRGLHLAERSVAMVHRGHTRQLDAGGVAVRRAAPDDAQLVAGIVTAGGPKWAKVMVLKGVLAGILEPGHSFYIGELAGEPVGTVQLLVDGATAGIYGVATLKAHRQRGVCTALMATAIADARAAGCDVIGLRTEMEGPVRKLYASLGFEEAHTSSLWVQHAR